MKKNHFKLLLSSLMAAAGCTSVYTFPALYIYFANKEQFAVKTALVLPLTFLLFIVSTLLIGVIIHLFHKKKCYPAILSFLVALAVYGVIQYHFSSGFFPNYLEEYILLYDIILMSSINVLLIIFPFFAAYKSQTFISKNIVKISLVLLLTQIAYGFVPLVTHKDKIKADYDFLDYTFSEKEKFSFGNKENIIVLVVDSMGESIAKEMMEKYPEVQKIMKDFMMCDRLTSPVPQTMYAIPAMLSGVPFPVNDDGTPQNICHASYLNRVCRAEHSLFQALKKLGFRTEGYSFILQTICYAPDVIDNSVPITREMKKSSIMLLPSLMLEKFIPVKLSNSFDMTFLNPQQATAQPEDEENNGIFDRNFYRSLSEKFSVGTTSKVFKYLHIHGAHDPVHTDEELCENSDGSRLDQLRGSFKIVDMLLTKLKQHDLYNDSTIIITGDHTETYSQETICFIKRRKVTRNAMAVNSTPHLISDIAGTILDEYGISSSLPYIKRDEENKIENTNPATAIQKNVDFSEWEKCEEINFQHADEFIPAKAILQNDHLLLESFPDGKSDIEKFRLRIISSNDDNPIYFQAECAYPGYFRYMCSKKLDLPDGVYRVQLDTLYTCNANLEEHLRLISRRLLNKFLIIENGIPKLSSLSGTTAENKLKVGKKLEFLLLKEYPMLRLPQGGIFKAGYILIPDGSTIMINLAPGKPGCIKIDIGSRVLTPCYINVSASNGFKIRQQINDMNSFIRIPLENCPLDERLYINLGFEIPRHFRKNFSENVKIKINSISRE